ncbi:zinc finger MYM-type protein 1-like [Oratosquilla oratoria]|uniref:zinc finger MYM-type protein 1-like n=1 Tax=Oratosquilla oratoria TaxID=337810 RepID=UPI003F773CB5
MKDLTIKPLSETRWESRIDALKPLRYHLADIYDALLETYEDTNLKGSSGSSTRVEAKELADAVSKYDKHLQDKDADLNSSTKQLEATKSYLLSCRCDDGFKKVLVDATEVAQDLEIEPQIEKKQSRKRRKKRLFDYEACEESLEDPSETFKVESYHSVLEMAIQSVEERFHQLHSYKAIFGFLYDIHGIKNAPNADILHDCQNLEKSLTHNGHHDIDARDLCSELKAVSRRLTKPMLTQAALCFIFEQKLQDSVPNVVIALRILLNLPVSVASGERSFSKLKLIKTYLRSTMLQQRLVGLATISIENVEASNLDLAKLVEKFASLKARKVELNAEITRKLSRLLQEDMVRVLEYNRRCRDEYQCEEMDAIGNWCKRLWWHWQPCPSWLRWPKPTEALALALAVETSEMSVMALEASETSASVAAVLEASVTAAKEGV